MQPTWYAFRNALLFDVDYFEDLLCTFVTHVILHCVFLLFLLVSGWWRWALVSPDGVAPSQIVCVSASVNLPLHHKVQKFSSGTGSPGWSRKKGRKMVVCVSVCDFLPGYLACYFSLIWRHCYKLSSQEENDLSDCWYDWLWPKSGPRLDK